MVFISVLKQNTLNACVPIYKHVPWLC